MVEAYDDLILEPVPGEAMRVEAPPAGSRYNGPLEWAEYLALRALLGIGLRLPESAQAGMVAALASLARRFDRRHTEAARDFIGTALPDWDARQRDELLTLAWRNLCLLAFEGFRTASMRGRRLGEHYDVEPCEGLDELRASDQGAVVITVHVGVWEALGLPLGALGIGPLYAVGKPPKNVPVARFVERTRRAAGGHMLPRHGAMQVIPRAVRQGCTVLMLLDQRPVSKSVMAPFFGRQAPCDRSSAVLMRRLKVPLVFVACYRQPQRYRYRLMFSRIVQPEQLSGCSAEEIIGMVNRESQRLILECPEQYFWLHDRYKGRTRSQTSESLDPGAGLPQEEPS